ncbi:hypothetical protein PR202_ga23465 [Eleusine coracana subsp. coracana]|uniref:non-specific serine/threonine protein kinase n=1 Tax=Eleusine coracana subsp. coracana TaxID=191504 RepID=A0AAV5D6X6_ELECO|nr:hypothetical protein PR202_ga23465 [Eleusine coracana subsp. coracana]
MNNNFTGPIPESLGNLSSLIAMSLGNLNTLQFINLEHNSLSEEIPRSLYNLSSLIFFAVGGNNLRDHIPVDIGDKFPGIGTFSVEGNQFSGGYNDITGSIPLDIGNLVGLDLLEMEHTFVSGAIPDSICSFEAECEALSRARHRCLIKIITCCSSIDPQGQEFKALVFEIMPNGSLDDWLHPKSDSGVSSNTLNLSQRLDIAVDIVDALDYLHNHCDPQIIHCDLKPSNILLAEDMSAPVADFGISKVLSENAINAENNSNSTIGIRGSIGYVAPEYGEGSSVSTLGDVYSLGILLLEMFTGRSPIDDMFRGTLDLHKFSEYALPDRISEIVDSTVCLQAENYDSITRSKTDNCLVSVIALGISCSKKNPRERTLIQNAAAEMHAIRDAYLIVARSVAVE